MTRWKDYGGVLLVVNYDMQEGLWLSLVGG